MSNVFNCAECGKPLSSLDTKHGWVTARGSRIHTLCVAKWIERTWDDRSAKTKAVT